MAVDPYAPCPGGTGKKIKFCCADLMSDLDKLRRMLEGDQRLACLDQVNKLHDKFGDRACLLAVKSMLESQLGNDDAADATIQTYLSKYPDNPVALAEQAMLKAADGDTRTAIEAVVRAIELSGESMPARVYEAIGALATVLITQGEILSGRALLLIQAEIGGSEDTRPLSLLMRILSAPQVPLLFKEDPAWAMAPEGVAWVQPFEEALQLALRGAWRGAADKFRALLATAGDHPAIWKNLSVLYAWLADKPAALDALRKYASLDIPLDDAVEAEALAQLLDEDSVGPEIDVVTLVYTTPDIVQLESRLYGNRASKLNVDLSSATSEGEPPPRSAYWLLDRPLPATGVGIALDAVPHVLATVYLFGKQTDREARLEMVVARTELQAAREALAKLAGDALSGPTEERVTTAISATAHSLSWNWRLPDDTPPAERQALTVQERHNVLFTRWPNLKMRLLDGKSPQEAAADPANRIKLLAAILLLELTDSQGSLANEYNGLRRNLNLPTVEPIDPTAVQVATLPVVRLGRVEIEKLSDDDLIHVYQRTSVVRAEAALRRVAKEIVRRPSLDTKVDKAEAYGVLSRLETDAAEALRYLDEARRVTKAAGKSTARWELEELSLQLQIGNGAAVARIVEHIRNHHIREPGVAQAMFNMLAEAGLIGPDGGMPAGAAAPQSSIVVPGGAEQQGSKLWTPDGAQPSGQKQTIWTPD